MIDLWQHIDALAEAGELRRLGGSFARFVVALDPDAGAAAPVRALAVACVLLSNSKAAATAA